MVSIFHYEFLVHRIRRRSHQQGFIGSAQGSLSATILLHWLVTCRCISRVRCNTPVVSAFPAKHPGCSLQVRWSMRRCTSRLRRTESTRTERSRTLGSSSTRTLTWRWYRTTVTRRWGTCRATTGPATRNRRFATVRGSARTASTRWDVSQIQFKLIYCVSVLCWWGGYFTVYVYCVA